MSSYLKIQIMLIFFFYFLQEFSNPLLFAQYCCYSNELTCLSCSLMQKSEFSYKKVIILACRLI